MSRGQLGRDGSSASQTSSSNRSRLISITPAIMRVTQAADLRPDPGSTSPSGRVHMKHRAPAVVVEVEPVVEVFDGRTGSRTTRAASLTRNRLPRCGEIRRAAEGNDKRALGAAVDGHVRGVARERPGLAGPQGQHGGCSFLVSILLDDLLR